MDLAILERLMLMSILPAQGDITTLKIVQELKLAIGFSEEELEEHSIVFSGERVDWNPKSNEYVKDIPIGPRATSVIVEELERKNTAKELTSDFISLYDKFMEDN